MDTAEKMKKGVGLLAGVAMLATLSVGVPGAVAAAPAGADAEVSAQADVTTVQEGLATVKYADGTVDATFNTVKDAAQEASRIGGTLVLNNDARVAAQTDAIVVWNDMALNLNGFTLSAPAFVHPIEATAGELTITGEGTVTGGPALTVYNNASVTIESGTFSALKSWEGGGNSSATAIQVVKDASATGVVTIKGGTFTAESARVTWKTILDQVAADTAPRFVVEGGTFSGYDPANGDDNSTTDTYLAEGYQSASDGNGNYVVSKKTYAVESNGTTSYTSDASQVSALAAADGATVTLRANVTDAPALTFDHQVTVTADEGVTFNGTLTFNANDSAAKNVTFLLAKGAAPVAVADGVTGTQLEGNTYKTADVSAYRSGTQLAVAPTAPAGQAFAGWYEDAAFGTPLATTATSGEAYAKFVNVADLVKFTPSVSSRTNDPNDQFSKAGLRFGYNVYLPEGAAFSTDSAWKVGTQESALNRTVNAKVYVPEEDGSVQTNYVLNLPESLYEKAYYVQFTAVYTTADGTKVSVTEPQVQRLTVKEAAEQAKDNTDLNEYLQWYAGELLKYLNAKQ